MSDTDAPNPFDPFGFWKGLAPQTLSQPILPGLFGVTINQTNSSAPDTEQKILAKDSYGRQIGKLTDAVAELIKAQKVEGQPLPEPYDELIKLKKRVDQAKLEAAEDRLKRIKSDLDLLKAHKREDYHKLLKGLEDLLKAEKTGQTDGHQTYEKMRHTL